MNNNKFILYGIVIYILTELSVKILSNFAYILIISIFDFNDLIYLLFLILTYLVSIYLVLFKIKKLLKIKLYVIILILFLLFTSNFLFTFLPVKQEFDNAVNLSIEYAIKGLYPVVFLIIGYIKYRKINNKD